MTPPIPVHLPAPARARRPLAVLASLALALVASVAFAAPASAHNQLESSVPASGASVAAPSEIVLKFSDKVLDVGTANRVLVSGPDGPATNTLAVAGSKVTATFDAALPAGDYRVEWRVASADGHPVSGKYAFTVKASATPSTSPTETAGTPTGTASVPASIPASVPATTPASMPAVSGDSDGGGSRTIVIIVAVLVALGAGTMLVARRAGSRRGGST